MSVDYLKQQLQAAQGNMADLARTRLSLRNLLQWHEQQKVVHDLAIEALQKAMASHDAVIVDQQETWDDIRRKLDARDDNRHTSEPEPATDGAQS